MRNGLCKMPFPICESRVRRSLATIPARAAPDRLTPPPVAPRVRLSRPLDLGIPPSRDWFDCRLSRWDSSHERPPKHLAFRRHRNLLALSQWFLLVAYGRRL